jgi:hypothetical protein
MDARLRVPSVEPLEQNHSVGDSGFGKRVPAAFAPAKKTVTACLAWLFDIGQGHALNGVEW